jgi:outer membrane protein assembly factor BamA
VVRVFIFFLIVNGIVHSANAGLDSLRNRSRSKVVQDTSKLVTINRVLIIGNKITRDKIIFRELSLRSGDTVRLQTLSQVITKDQIKLMNTRLFNTATIRSLDYENGIIDLLVEVSERWYTFPVPIVELADRNFNEWWENYNHDFRRLNYGLKLYQYNFRGRNETLRLTAKFGFTNIFKLTYRIPYLDRKQKQGLIFDFSYDERKNIAFRTFENKLEFARADRNFKVSRNASITYTYRNSFYHFHGITFELNNIRINDSLQQLNPEYLGASTINEQHFSTLAYQYTYENRDFVTYPLKGSFLNAYVKQSGLFRGDELTKTEMEISYAKYVDLGKKFFLSNNSATYVSLQDDVPYANYSALGYNRQFVRGYEVYLIEGPQHVYNKTTLKRLIYSNVFNLHSMPLEQFQKIPLAIYLKTYADVGYVWNYPGYINGRRLTDKPLTGVGMGLDFVSSHDATVRLEYSLNGEGEHGFFFHLKREF